MKIKYKLIIFVLLLLVLDQIVKFVIKTNMTLGQEIPVLGNWFKIAFVENKGMAFGMKLGSGEFAKIALSLFRIFAVSAIGWYIYKLIQKNTKQGVLFAMSLILCGALGNIIDSLFYGIIFNESTYTQIATFMPEAGGYASFLHGKVVDMLYFPLIEGRFPAWIPIWGGENFIFFRPVFNFADSYITIGVAMLLIFHRDFFKEEVKL